MSHPSQNLPNDTHSVGHPSTSLACYTAPPPIPPETYSHLIRALLSLQGVACPQNHPTAYPYPIHPTPLPNCHYPWPPGTAPAIPSVSTSNHPTNTLPLRAVPQTAASPQPTTSPAASTIQDPEGTEDAGSIAEEKRRRNTAASARFRIKKKLKTSNLERTVTDLTGRAEDLEREAADLRRENAWLKEIVLLKGRNLNLGSQAPTPGNRRDDGESDDRTHVETEPESIIGSRGQVKEQEKEKESMYSLARPDFVFPRGDVLDMSFGRPPSINVGFQPAPPDRGSFPLDHDGECRDKMMEYMACLKQHSGTSTPCRALSRQYLECRMSKGLMQRDDFTNLGLGNVDDADVSGKSKH